MAKLNKTNINIWSSKLDAEEEVVKRERTNIVVEHNDLIDRAKQDLTAPQMKLMDYLISRIRPSDSEFVEITTTMSRLSKTLRLSKSGRTYTQLWNALRALRAKEVVLLGTENGKKFILSTGWLQTVWSDEDGNVKVRIDQRLAPYLLNMAKRGHYTQSLLSDAAQLRGKYALVLYKQISMNRGLQHWNPDKTVIVGSRTLGFGTPEWWQEKLGMPDSFKVSAIVRTVKRAVDEINKELSGYHAEVKIAYRGRSVQQLEVHVTIDPYVTFYGDKTDVSNHLANTVGTEKGKLIDQ